MDIVNTRVEKLSCETSANITSRQDALPTIFSGHVFASVTDSYQKSGSSTATHEFIFRSCRPREYDTQPVLFLPGSAKRASLLPTWLDSTRHADCCRPQTEATRRLRTLRPPVDAITEDLRRLTRRPCGENPACRETGVRLLTPEHERREAWPEN